MCNINQIPDDDVVFIVGTTFLLVSVIGYLIRTYSKKDSYEHFYSYEPEDDEPEVIEPEEKKYDVIIVDESDVTSDSDFDTSDCVSEESSSDEEDSIAYRRVSRRKRCFHYITRKGRKCKKKPSIGSNYCACHQ
jgi:hypothetical protein